MSLLKITVFSVWILLISLLPVSGVFAQPKPTEEEATVTGSTLGVGFLLRILIFIVIGAIAVITILVLRKKRFIF